MEEEGSLDFSFWPSFADLMLALVLILVLVLFLVTAVIAAGTVDLSDVKNNQKDMVEEIAASYRCQPKELKKEENGISIYSISITGPDTFDLVIKNEPTLQRITFSDQILFQPNDYRLNPKGEDVLKTVGAALKKQLSRIKEIQIQGHADPDKPRYESNIHLAAFRAIEVYKFLQKEESAGIDPARHLMSATSFGEFKPVQRPEKGGEYNQDLLREHNGTPELKGRNRRIELLLFY